jgi:thiol:disulfide interchange protein
MRVWKALLCAAVLTVMAAPAAHADEWNKKTILTFSGPVQLPGATLPAGSYVFKLADLNGNRHVVQVFDKDEQKIFATLMAIPNERLEPADEPLILFSERAAGSPQAVKVWFYPGERIGNEFVYPKSQAVAIAKANKTSVLAVADNTSSNAYKTAEVGRFDDRGVWQPEGEKAVATTAPPATTAPKATTSDSTMAKSTASGSTASQSNTAGTSGKRSSRKSLPRTASTLPLMALLSALALAGGLALRRARA